MPITLEDIHDFSQFATARLENGGAEFSLSELAQQWQAVREREEVNAAIREGLADIDAGRTQPAREFMDEMRKKYNISPDA